MKLFWSAASPYARKVRAVAREKGLAGRIDEVIVDAFRNPPDLIAANPLGKVPTLVLDDGVALYDSPVICAWLDATGDGPPLVPESGPARFQVLRAEALADGLMDLGLGLTLERRKPDGERSPTSAARWRGQIVQAVDAIAQDGPALPNGMTLGHLAYAVALGYLDFRHPDMAWRDGRPDLAGWYATAAARWSLAETAPQ